MRDGTDAMRVCLFGCGGFIGSHLAEWLLERSLRTGLSRTALLGDLAEEHARLCSRRRLWADGWYWAQALEITGS